MFKNMEGAQTILKRYVEDPGSVLYIGTSYKDLVSPAAPDPEVMSRKIEECIQELQAFQDETGFTPFTELIHYFQLAQYTPRSGDWNKFDNQIQEIRSIARGIVNITVAFTWNQAVKDAVAAENV